MAFNFDTKSIFDNYVNQILEQSASQSVVQSTPVLQSGGAVRPVEVSDGDPSFNKVNPGDKLSRNQAIQKWEETTGKKYGDMTREQKRGNARTIMNIMRTGEIQPPEGLQGRLPVKQPAPPVAPAQAAPATAQPAPAPGDEFETSTIQKNIVSSKPVVTANDGSAVSDQAIATSQISDNDAQRYMDILNKLKASRKK